MGDWVTETNKMILVKEEKEMRGTSYQFVSPPEPEPEPEEKKYQIEVNEEAYLILKRKLKHLHDYRDVDSTYSDVVIDMDEDLTRYALSTLDRDMERIMGRSYIMHL